MRVEGPCRRIEAISEAEYRALDYWWVVPGSGGASGLRIGEWPLAL